MDPPLTTGSSDTTDAFMFVNNPPPAPKTTTKRDSLAPPPPSALKYIRHTGNGAVRSTVNEKEGEDVPKLKGTQVSPTEVRVNTTGTSALVHIPPPSSASTTLHAPKAGEGEKREKSENSAESRGRSDPILAESGKESEVSKIATAKPPVQQTANTTNAVTKPHIPSLNFRLSVPNMFMGAPATATGQAPPTPKASARHPNRLSLPGTTTTPQTPKTNAKTTTELLSARYHTPRGSIAEKRASVFQFNQRSEGAEKSDKENAAPRASIISVGTTAAHDPAVRTHHTAAAIPSIAIHVQPPSSSSHLTAAGTITIEPKNPKVNEASRRALGPLQADFKHMNDAQSAAEKSRFKDEYVDVFSAPKTFKERTDALFGPTAPMKPVKAGQVVPITPKGPKEIIADLPEMKELQAFLKLHADQIEQIKSKGWAKLKKELDTKMKLPDGSKPSYEALRKQLVAHIIKVTQAIIKKMGEEEVGKHSDLGTPGWDSDIDTTLIAPNNMREKTKIIYKFTFDMLVYSIFQTTGDRSIDTVCFLQHPALFFKTQENLTTPEGHKKNAYVEKLLTTFHRYQCIRQNFGSNWKTEWEKWTKDELDAIAKINPKNRDPKLNLLHAATKEIHVQVEKFYERCEEEVEIQMIIENDPNLRKLHEDNDPSFIEEYEGYDNSEKRKKLCKEILKKNPNAEEVARLSHKTDHLLRLGEKMDKDNDTLGDMDLVENTMGANKEIYKDFLKIGLKRDLAICYIFFDEAIYSDGCIDKVCYKRGGQGVQREEDRTIKIKTGLDSADKNFTFEGMMHQVSDENMRAPTSLDENSSQDETMAQYQGHFRGKIRKEDDASYQDALVSNSKYSERGMNSNMHSLKFIHLNRLRNDDENRILFEAAIKDPTLNLATVFENEVGENQSNNALLEVAATYPSLLALRQEAEGAYQASEILKRIGPEFTVIDVSLSQKNKLSDLDFAIRNVLMDRTLTPQTKLQQIKEIAKNNPELSTKINKIENEYRAAYAQAHPINDLELVIDFLLSKAQEKNPDFAPDVEFLEKLETFLKIASKNYALLSEFVSNVDNPLFIINKIKSLPIQNARLREVDVKVAQADSTLQADTKEKVASNEAIEKLTTDEVLEKLTMESAAAHATTSELLKCKRRNFLNKIETERLLTKALVEKYPNTPREIIKACVDEVVLMQEPGGLFEKSKEFLTPDDKFAFYYSKIASYVEFFNNPRSYYLFVNDPKTWNENRMKETRTQLAKEFYMSKEQAAEKSRQANEELGAIFDTQFTNILKARAGFLTTMKEDDKNRKQLEGLIKSATKETLNQVKLTTKAEITKFNEKIESLNRNTRILSQIEGVIPLIEPDETATANSDLPVSLNFLDRWLETSAKK